MSFGNWIEEQGLAEITKTQDLLRATVDIKIKLIKSY